MKTKNFINQLIGIPAITLICLFGMLLEPKKYFLILRDVYEETFYSIWLENRKWI